MQALDELVRGSLRLNSTSREVSSLGMEPVQLSNLEFQVLYLLMSHPGQALSADLIVERVWGRAGEGDAALLTNVIYRLRRKVEPDPNQPRYLQTRIESVAPKMPAEQRPALRSRARGRVWAGSAGGTAIMRNRPGTVLLFPANCGIIHAI